MNHNMGKKVQICQSAILNKILTFDIMKLMRETGSMAEFDAKANYDRIIPDLVILASQTIGMGKKLRHNAAHSTKH